MASFGPDSPGGRLRGPTFADGSSRHQAFGLQPGIDRRNFFIKVLILRGLAGRVSRKRLKTNKLTCKVVKNKELAGLQCNLGQIRPIIWFDRQRVRR